MNLDDLADRTQAETVPCPNCHAAPGWTCRRDDGQHLQHLPAHIGRLKAAGVVHAPLDPRELARPHERTPRS